MNPNLALMQVGTKNSISNNTPKRSWMGYGIVPGSVDEEISIDILPYLLWAHEFSSENQTQHRIIIADDLASHNGLDLKRAREMGDRKKSRLQRIIDYWDLDVDVLLWREIAEEPRYRDLLNRLTSLAENDFGLLGRLYNALPRTKKRKDDWSISTKITRIGYVLEEIAISIYLNKIGWPIKVGHKLERGYDSRILDVYAHPEYRNYLGISNYQSMMIYLRGGHSIEAGDCDDVVPPYLVVDPNKRIVLTDDRSSIIGKLERSSEFYRNWCRDILQSTTEECVPEDLVRLSSSLYKTIKPLEGLQ